MKTITNTKKETKTQPKTEVKKPTQYTKGTMKIAEFMNTAEDGKRYSSFVIQKMYKEKDSEEWKTTSSFSLSDLMILSFMITEVINEVKQTKIRNPENVTGDEE